MRNSVVLGRALTYEFVRNISLSFIVLGSLDAGVTTHHYVYFTAVALIFRVLKWLCETANVTEWVFKSRKIATYHLNRILGIGKSQPIAVAARSEAWTSFARSNTVVVGSNLTRGIDVWVYSMFVLSCVDNGLAAGWSLAQGVLPTVYMVGKI
jgi:hypothetical protein